VSLRELLRRFGEGAPDATSSPRDEEPGLDTRPPSLPDPSKPPTARGSWEQAALVNIALTERIKGELGTHTPPWKK
jgi:hypothetical protein